MEKTRESSYCTPPVPMPSMPYLAMLKFTYARFRLFLPIDSTTQEKRPIETPKEASIAREAFSRADDFDAFVADQQDKEAQKSRTMREDMRRDNGLGDIPEEDRYFSSSQYRFDTYDETALRNGPRGDSGWMGNRDRSMRQYEDSMYT